MPVAIELVVAHHPAGRVLDRVGRRLSHGSPYSLH
jgi:hypothetical protein